MKALILLSLLLTACSQDAKSIHKEIKRGFDKVTKSPATKELTDDAKRGFRKADAAVTKQLEKGRDKIRETVHSDPK